jgi:hypothetical protein
MMSVLLSLVTFVVGALVVALVGVAIEYDKNERSKVMFGGGYKKKKILKLAKEYASRREFGWEMFYREMSGLLR